ncbi:hypothetical protein E2C01_016195 [Portunus trituberculatus]|uniref:Uncharacterized protein n=1 Tax=Portunus trituberculatus TaxID=210409 RepID=A0A5B7DQF2_PORTR|nr:hypothetical protein [Portunus trituberculatus]
MVAGVCTLVGVLSPPPGWSSPARMYAGVAYKGEMDSRSLETLTPESADDPRPFGVGVGVATGNGEQVGVEAVGVGNPLVLTDSASL